MPGTTLIIKTGASGDVVRTTVLLRVLQGEVVWITDFYNIPLFPDHLPSLRLIDMDNIPPDVIDAEYDLVLSLEEDFRIASVINKLRYKKLTGVFVSGNKLEYTPDSSAWYDMSLISTHGRKAADSLKMNNRRTYQEMLFSMIGKTFSGERYLIYRRTTDANNTKVIGIDKTAGGQWPDKNWAGFDELSTLLGETGHKIIIFKRRDRLRDFLDDISGCSMIICSDTLTMHIALAYEIPVVGIFNCTSPDEIHDYGILEKVVSPRLREFYYSREFNPEAVSAIPVKQVYDTVIRKLNQPGTVKREG